jgi:hypothetical protein
VIDRQAPLRFLRTAYDPEDWVAVLLKSYDTGHAVQRVGPVNWIASPRFQAWLRAKNAGRANVFVSVNVVQPDQRSRRRDAVRAIRHLFLDADRDASHVVAAIAVRSDLPSPSYVLHSSPHRAHIFWRVTGFTIAEIEALQKRLTAELGTDPAATASSQLTRLPGFINYKRPQPWLVSIDYHNVDRIFGVSAFGVAVVPNKPRRSAARVAPSHRGALDRARRYLAAIPPAVVGHHGDVQTFRVACRLVRGFALDDDKALTLLSEWNARCRPPWQARDLVDKLSRARQYGREPIGGLLKATNENSSSWQPIR